EAWLRAMLDAERALANAGAIAGLVPAHLAGEIADRCRPELYDIAALCRSGRASGNPVVPLVHELRAGLGGQAADFVHRGATSQDVLDSAACLVARRALRIVFEQLDLARAGCAELARAHRLTPMAGRTLLQHAVPVSFGLTAAGWLTSLSAATARLRVCDRALPAQLGGAAGTLAAVGEHGPALLGLFARELELAEPVIPWHTDRVVMAELGAALAVAAGAVAKIALDVVLLSQTELGELSEPSAGGSSTMPQKQNPVGSTLAIACSRQVQGHAGVLLGALAQEHQRAAGAWHAEWDALTGALAHTGAAAAAMAGVLDGLQVHPDAMRRNLEAAGGVIVAERVAQLLAPEVGPARAQQLVGEAARAAAAGGSLRELLPADPALPATAFDPTGYLGSSALFVDRALARYAAEDGSG
ncbi:MAG TPA: lyase family protein, partial [Gaiellales bacterium]|nr:lyase family protein [Gaiellales bacterium]